MQDFLQKMLPEHLYNTETNFIQVFFEQNSGIDYIKAFLLFAIIFLSIQFFRLILKVWVEKITDKTKTKIDDFIVHTLDKRRRVFFLFTSFLLALKSLVVPESFMHIMNEIFFVLLVVEVAKIAVHSVEFLFERYAETYNKAKKAAFFAARTISRFLIWFLAFMFVLSNFGINIASLMTGFGIAGVAVAFAFQSILKDLFSYFTILLDRPVDVGDYIKVDDKGGTVDKIGIKTTRLKSVDGEEIVIPNTSLTENNVDNFGKANYRRVVSTLKVPLETKVVDLKKMKKKLIEIVESFPDNTLERCHLRTITNQDLEFELVYRIEPRDYSLYMNTNEAINFAILDYFDKEKMMFPYPAEIMINKEAGELPGYYLNKEEKIS